MTQSLPTYIGDQAIPQMVRYLRAAGYERVVLVADQNTFGVLGRAADAALRAAGCRLTTVILDGGEVLADERHLVQVLLRIGPDEQLFVAVGSGTITDVARFISHRSGRPFISVPTAPSVDGFTSPVAPLAIDRLKVTVPAQAPCAVFADLAVLCAAPQAMIAAGFGDMLGKYVALADWPLGNLLVDDPYDAALAARMRGALERCVAAAAGIGCADRAAIHNLLLGLLESGLCMIEFGNSRPASGAEHFVSHFWETRLLLAGRPAILHGAKVGVGTVLMSRYYQAVRQMSQGEAERRLRATPRPSKAAEQARIAEAWGPGAAGILAEQAPWLDLPDDDYAALQRKIVVQWPAIQAIAATVPAPEQISALLAAAHAPLTPADLGLEDTLARMALRNCQDQRQRMTIARLRHMLGLELD